MPGAPQSAPTVYPCPSTSTAVRAGTRASGAPRVCSTSRCRSKVQWYTAFSLSLSDSLTSSLSLSLSACVCIYGDGGRPPAVFSTPWFFVMPFRSLDLGMTDWDIGEWERAREAAFEERFRGAARVVCWFFFLGGRRGGERDRVCFVREALFWRKTAVVNNRWAGERTLRLRAENFLEVSARGLMAAKLGIDSVCLRGLLEVKWGYWWW